jgi:hypothetical protein
MSASELLEEWGREVLRERGFTVEKDAAVYFDLTTETEGCCEMCYSSQAVIEVRSGKFSTTVSYI